VELHAPRACARGEAWRPRSFAARRAAASGYHAPRMPTIDIVNNPANPENPSTEQLLDLPHGGTIAFYGEKAGAALQLRITSLKREGEHAGQFLIEGHVRLQGDAEESRVESSFYNAATRRGTLHVEDEFAGRYEALSEAIPASVTVTRPQ
jgi:hypothetical protein